MGEEERLAEEARRSIAETRRAAAESAVERRGDVPGEARTLVGTAEKPRADVQDWLAFRADGPLVKGAPQHEV